MKGIIFTTFNKMIEEKFGMNMWEELIDKTAPESDGVYVATASYPDSELINMVVCLSEKTNTPVENLIHAFGEYAFHELVSAYPKFAEGKTIKEFLKSIHGVVHVEVKKLYPEVELPDFYYEDPEENKLIMEYHSKRELPSLAAGLIQGAADHFKVKIDQKVEEIKENDKTYHRFELTFLP